jgi:AraC-like DNA-binding protein
MYLYFKRLSELKSLFKKRDLLHFLAPILIIGTIWLNNYLSEEFYIIFLKIGIFFFLLMSFIYLFTCYKLLKNNAWNRRSDIVVFDNQFKLIKQWTQILFIILIVMFIKFTLNIVIYEDLLWFKNQNQYLWIVALVWIVVYFKMLYSPEILYGYQAFQNKIIDYKKSVIVFDEIWITTGKQVLNKQDSILQQKILTSIQHYIIEIEDLIINTNIFLFENFDIGYLANKLGIPKSHVFYIFKYHSNVSFVDLKKIIRIQKAIELIDEGYLKNNTLEALSIQTGFSSYSTFFKSFKSITGGSPKDYINY